jgi:DNA-binding NarL/FixJ family response regulator
MSVDRARTPHACVSCGAAASAPDDMGAILARIARLSARELEVFDLLATGASNRLISGRLRITERTVKAHVAQIVAKLGLESKTQASIAAFAWAMRAEAGDDSLPAHMATWRLVTTAGTH